VAIAGCGRSLTHYGDVLNPDRLPLNLARFVFLDERSPEFFVDWSSIADDVVASLRLEVGRNPVNRSLSDLVGELFWEHEFYRRFFEYIARHVRVTVFDKRAIGLSDKFHEAPTLEQRTTDILTAWTPPGWTDRRWLERPKVD
jgi:hypothetical protein